MYYNRFLRVWVFDPLDIFLISALVASLLASYLKTYLSEKVAIERLKNSIINESELLLSNRPVLKYKRSKKEDRIKLIAKFALNNRGGQLEPFETNEEFSNAIIKIQPLIKGMVERLASYLKRKELRGKLKPFFRYGRLILELLLYKCNIYISYALLNEGLSTQVVVFTATMGGATGFALSWFSVGAAVITPSLIVSTILIRSITKQILNEREYLKFKTMVNKMLIDDDLKKIFQARFLEGEDPVSSSIKIEMGSVDSNKKTELIYDFSEKPSEEFNKFIKEKAKEELGLVETPAETQLKKIIKKKLKKNSKGKIVYFRDFIKEMPDSVPDLPIIDAKIID